MFGLLAGGAGQGHLPEIGFCYPLWAVRVCVYAIWVMQCPCYIPAFLCRCRHGVPEQLLSERETNFLSDLICEICNILGVKKINTSRYHPQTDGLVEIFNSTLINMVAKCWFRSMIGMNISLCLLVNDARVYT